MSKKITLENGDAAIAFINSQVTKWRIMAKELDASYAQVAVMLAITIGKLLYVKDNDELNKQAQAYLRRQIKEAFEAEKSYYDGLQK